MIWRSMLLKIEQTLPCFHRSGSKVFASKNNKYLPAKNRTNTIIEIVTRQFVDCSTNYKEIEHVFPKEMRNLNKNYKINLFDITNQILLYAICFINKQKCRLFHRKHLYLCNNLITHAEINHSCNKKLFWLLYFMNWPHNKFLTKKSEEICMHQQTDIFTRIHNLQRGFSNHQPPMKLSSFISLLNEGNHEKVWKIVASQLHLAMFLIFGKYQNKSFSLNRTQKKMKLDESPFSYA